MLSVLFLRTDAFTEQHDVRLRCFFHFALPFEVVILLAAIRCHYS